MNKAERWLDQSLQFQFQESALLVQALTHRSASGNNNERLEFLGDAILDFVISEALFRLRPNADEGDLSRLRASLVRDRTLGSIAEELGLADHLVLGGGELKSGAYRRSSILADALEALFGAAFLDQGFEPARALIERVFESRLLELPDARELRDAKTRLQEWLQERGLGLPVYATESMRGKEHARVFTVSCRVAEKSEQTEGTARSRRAAEQEAARAMLAQIAGDRS